MKNNRGVSIMSLVVTIVLIIIIAGVTIYYGGMQNIEKTTSIDAYTEAMNISEAILSRSFFNRTNSDKYPLVGRPLSDTDFLVVNDVTYGDGWYELTPEDAIDLQLENIKKSYIINYSTGDVISKEPIYIEDEVYYTLNELKVVVGEDKTAVYDDMYNETKGVNKPLLVEGMIPVRNINGKWIVTNAEDTNWYDYSSDSNMWANVMLNDEIEINGFTNSEVRATELINLEGREVTKNGSMFVWIPRYSKNSEGNIVFSEIFNDYTIDDYEVDSAFTNDGDVTGFWMSKYDASIVQ